MWLKRGLVLNLRIDIKFAPCMGLKRQKQDKTLEIELFSPDMGLKSCLAFFVLNAYKFAPYMGFKNDQLLSLFYLTKIKKRLTLTS
jgi:hypothetical protein